MAGKRKPKKSQVLTANPSNNRGRNNGRRNDNANLSRNTQSRSPEITHRRQSSSQVASQGNSRGRTRIARARIVENDAIVDISTEGQDTEFVDEMGTQSDSMSSDEHDNNDGNGVATNNNATIATIAEIHRPNQLEDGECDDADVAGPSAKRSRTRTDGMANPTRGNPNDDLRSYVDQKFSALAKMVELERELSDKNRELDLLRAKGNKGNKEATTILPNETLNGSYSELTIYKNAVEKSKRASSSSEEIIDTSNEMMPEQYGEGYDGDSDYEGEQRRSFEDEIDNDFDSGFIVEREIEKAKQLDRDRRRTDDRNRDRRTSGHAYDKDPYYNDRSDYRGRSDYDDNRVDGYRPLPPPKRDVVGEKSKRLVNEAEAAKARIYEVPGKYYFDEENELDYHEKLKDYRNKVSTSQMDEEYKMVAAHIDRKTRQQIINHEYLGFSRLLPRSRLGMMDEDQSMLQLVNRGGVAGLVSVSNRATAINSYSKWEQAFRVFSDIYTQHYPSRATELIQYNHTIHTASQSYIWDNVYMYDMEVRKHMEAHPSRNWGIILSMAWTMCVKDRYTPATKFQGKGGPGNKYPAAEMKQRKPCLDFNKGNCTYGNKCKFDHRCGFCSKFGHGTQSCRKFLASSATEKGQAVKKEN